MRPAVCGGQRREIAVSVFATSVLDISSTSGMPLPIVSVLSARQLRARGGWTSKNDKSSRHQARNLHLGPLHWIGDYFRSRPEVGVHMSDWNGSSAPSFRPFSTIRELPKAAALLRSQRRHRRGGKSSVRFWQSARDSGRCSTDASLPSFGCAGLPRSRGR